MTASLCGINYLENKLDLRADLEVREDHPWIAEHWVLNSLKVKALKVESWGQAGKSAWNFFKKNYYFYFFIWPHQVLVVAHKIFSCSMWDRVPWPGIEPWLPVLGAWSLSHWTTREAPAWSFLFLALIGIQWLIIRAESLKVQVMPLNPCSEPTSTFTIKDS